MSDQLPIWTQLISAKSPESWLAILGGSVYVWYKSGAASRIGKAVEAGISGLMAVSISPDIVESTGFPSALVHFSMAVGGFLILDILISMLQDKTALTELILSIIKKWFKVDGK